MCTELLDAIAYAVSSEVGARRARQAAAPTSPATLLHELATARADRTSGSHVLDVEDFAVRKGRRYGVNLLAYTTNRVSQYCLAPGS